VPFKSESKVLRKAFPTVIPWPFSRGSMIKHP
jgi:hypothetical protein